MQEKLLKIRNYFNKEREMVINSEIQRTLIEYLEEQLERFVARPEFLLGYVQCLKDIREIPRKVEELKK